MIPSGRGRPGIGLTIFKTAETSVMYDPPFAATVQFQLQQNVT